MADIDNVLERRANLLAGKLTQRRDLIRQTLAPPGQRPPFTTQLNHREALAFWRQHWSDDLGQQVKAGMAPQDLLELQLALSRANEEEMFGDGSGVL